MNLFLTLMTLLCLVSCQEAESNSETKSEYEMTCVSINTSQFNGTLKRCENKEVICYIIGTGYDDGQSSCKFKEPTNEPKK